MKPFVFSRRGIDCGGFDEFSADLKVHADVLISGDAFVQVIAPALERVGPAGHSVLVAAQLGDVEGSLPAIIEQGEHGHFVPAASAFLPVEQRAGEHFVPFDEDVSFHGDVLADYTLDGKSAAVY